MNLVMKKMNSFKKNQKGLTLVELLAVIVILGIVAAIAVPAISGVISNAKVDADVQSKKMVEEAAYLWYVTTNPAVDATITVSGLQAANFLKEVPKSAVNGNDFEATFTVTATGVTAAWTNPN